MSRLFLKYYIDITKYNLLFCLMCTISQDFKELIIIFGSFGFFVSVLLYEHFHKIEYYFYRNGGFSKQRLLFIAFSINLSISLLILVLIWNIH